MKVFITGGTSGIGLELAKLYLEEGHEVGVCGMENDNISPSLAKEFSRLSIFEVDVVKRDELRAVVYEFSQGKLDLMVANAGFAVGGNGTVPCFDVAREIVGTNILGVINTFEVAFEIMRVQGNGHLAAMASAAGMVGLPRVGPYCGSKAFVLKLCESLAIDFKQFGIRVTAIAPGFIDTPMTQKNHCRMPFLMPAAQAAFLIKRALNRKVALYIFPWQIKIVIYILDRMPRWTYRWLMGFISRERLSTIT